MRADLGPLRDDGAVDVSNFISGFAHEAARLRDEDVGRAPLPLGVVVGEELADVRHAERAGDGVHHAVQQYISVRAVVRRKKKKFRVVSTQRLDAEFFASLWVHTRVGTVERRRFQRNDGSAVDCARRAPPRRVRHAAAVVFDLDASEDELEVGHLGEELETVKVEAVTHPEGKRLDRGGRVSDSLERGRAARGSGLDAGGGGEGATGGGGANGHRRGGGGGDAECSHLE